MMGENLKCGFLHYHINDIDKEYFANNYPVIDQKTNQILYVYTDIKYRRNGIASQLINFIFQDMSKQNFSYIWLKKETSSQIYEKIGFQNFITAVYEILNDPEQFLHEYEKKSGFNKEALIDRYNDTRLVKILSN